MANEVPGDQQPSASRSGSAEIDAIGDQFEAAWRAGQQPRIDEYLPRLPESGRPELFRKVLAIELQLRFKAGEQPTPAEYVSRFAAYEQQIEAVFAKIAAAAESGDQSIASTLGRPSAWHVRCPHCHNPIELIDDNVLEEITCPSCGSRFALALDETLDYQPGTKTETPRRTIGHFELIEQLGVGGFGAVWKARDTKLDRIVAVKIPRRSNIDRKEREKFLREARTAAQLQHPNIVSVHEVGLEGDTIFIVSDFIEGGSLGKWLNDHRLSHRESAELCVKIARALHYAHEQGVIHRDLKPANIMLDTAGEAHIMDFGLAKREAGEITMTMEGAILGTPAYMSPEQAKGEGHKVDRRTDVYSLGVVLFELLTGERPFRGDVQMLLRQVAEDDPPSLRKMDSRISRDLETICLKCLAKEPERRYQTAARFAADLRCFLNHDPISARPSSMLYRARKRFLRHKAVATVGGIAFLLTVGLVIGWIVTLQQRTREAQDAAQRERESADAESAAKAEAKAGEAKAQAEERKAKAALAEAASNEAVAFGLAERYASAVVACEKGRTIRDTRVLRMIQWNAERNRGHPSRTLVGVPSDSSVRFSPDGEQLAAISGRGELRRWDVVTGEQTLSHEIWAIDSAAFSPDGKQLATASGIFTNKIELRDLATAKVTCTFTGHTEPVYALAFAPDGKRLASASRNGTVKVWDLVAAKCSLTVSANAWVHCVEFSPQGRLLACACGDNTVKLWDLTAAEESKTLAGHTDYVHWVAFSPDGTQLASASKDRTIKLWDVTTGRQNRTLTGHTDMVFSVAFRPDGRHLASASVDRTIKLWEVATGQELLTLWGHADPAWYVAFSVDGTQLASTSRNGTIKLWDIATGEVSLLLAGHTKSVRCVAFSSDGERLASASDDNTVKLWDTTAGKEILTLRGHNEEVLTLAFSPDGRTLASASKDKTIKLWGLATGRATLTLTAHTDPVYSLAFSPDGERLASAEFCGIIKVWDLASGNEIHTFKGRMFRKLSVTYRPDGTLLATENGAKDGIALWDVAGDRQMLTLMADGSPASTAFRPDGRQLAVASMDGIIKLWDLETGKETLTLTGPDEYVAGLAFRPDGKLLASGSLDDSVRLWDLVSGNEALALAGHTDFVHTVAFSPDGSRLASGSDDGTIRLWDVDRAHNPELRCGPERTIHTASPSTEKLDGRESR